MKYLVAVLFLVVPIFAFAFNPIFSATAVPYEVLTIDSRIEQQNEYLGELSGYPHMYEFTLGTEAVLVLKLAQKADEDTAPLRLSLIVVKENTNNAGVAEVGRQTAKSDTAWTERRDSALALTLLEGEEFVENLTPGTYRVEVSTPDNYGKYLLTVGDDPQSSGYFKLLGDIRTIQAFFGLPFLAIFLSSAVYYPLGIILLLVGIYFTWRNRQRIRSYHA